MAATMIGLPLTGYNRYGEADGGGKMDDKMHVRMNELDGSDDDGEADGGGKMG